MSSPSPYQSKKITSRQIDRLFEMPGWPKRGGSYTENHHGAAYWNSLTGEIMWIGEDPDESNATLLPATWAAISGVRTSRKT